MNAIHKATITVVNYPGSIYAERITWSCSCGKSGTLRDGRLVPTRTKALRASRRHYTPVTAR